MRYKDECDVCNGKMHEVVDNVASVSICSQCGHHHLNGIVGSKERFLRNLCRPHFLDLISAIFSYGRTKPK